MKKLRYTLLILCLMLVNMVSAQVMNVYSRGGQLIKFYMANVDSVKILPALDYRASIEVKSYYTEPVNGQDIAHVVFSVTVAPNADVALIAFGDRTYSYMEFQEGTVPSVEKLTKGMTQDVDFAIPDSTARCYATIYTQNNDLPYSYYTTEYTVDYANRYWKSLGMATITEDVISTFWGTKGLEWKCEMQENELKPGFYRLVNPYTSTFPYNGDGDYDDSRNYYLEIHAEDPNAVYIEKQELGLNWGYGMASINSMAGYYLAKGNSLEDIQKDGYCGTLKDGEITFPTKGLLVSMADYNDGAQYYANGNGLFSIMLPGYTKPDYTINLSYEGVVVLANGETLAQANLGLGAQAVDARAIVVARNADPTATAEAIARGELSAQKVDAGTIMVPFDRYELGSGKLQLIVAVLKDSEVKNMATTKFEYSNDTWKSLGIGSYTDDILMPMFTQDNEGTPYAPVTYEVEILESSETPGLYRIVDPYAIGVHPYASAISNSGIKMPSKGDCYLEVNATDPEGVYIATQELGVLWGGFLGVLTEAYRYMDMYEVDLLKQYGYFGTVRDGVVEFPAFYINGQDESGGCYQGIMTEDGEMAYYCGTNASMTFTLPSAYKASPRKIANKLIDRSLRQELKMADPSMEKIVQTQPEQTEQPAMRHNSKPRHKHLLLIPKLKNLQCVE